MNYTQDGLNNKAVASANPFRYRGYYYDTETNLYYLNTRYYDPETGRFINADDISLLDPENFNGLNLYAYCGNNPVNNVDAMGNKWWHWLVAAFVVVVAAVATVVTAGGAAAGIAAVASVVMGTSAATLGATVAAATFVATAVTFTAMAITAGIEAGIQGGSAGDMLNTFSSYGEEAMWSTIGAGIIGAGTGYANYKIRNSFVGKTPGSSTPSSKYTEYGNYKKVTYYDHNGNMSWSKHYTTHGFSGHNNPHWHLEDSINHTHSKPLNSLFEFIIEYIKRLFK